jgi:hypothetical protein
MTILPVGHVYFDNTFKLWLRVIGHAPDQSGRMVEQVEPCSEPAPAPKPAKVAIVRKTKIVKPPKKPKATTKQATVTEPEYGWGNAWDDAVAVAPLVGTIAVGLAAGPLAAVGALFGAGIVKSCFEPSKPKRSRH